MPFIAAFDGDGLLAALTIRHPATLRRSRLAVKTMPRLHRRIQIMSNM